jgi:hypothetical protein
MCVSAQSSNPDALTNYFLSSDSRDSQSAERLFFDSVILSAAKDLLFVRVAGKADPSVAQNRRNLRMTLLRVSMQRASS